MKMFLALLLVFSFALVVSGCADISDWNHNSQQTDPVQTDPSPTTQPESEPLQTEPEHSDLYIPGLAVDDVIVYFNEVCLDAEITLSGDPSVLQKWDEPIYYQINGQCTVEDEAVLQQFTQWLNTIEGFPGMNEVQEDSMPNLQIYFCSQQEMIEHLGENFSYMDGGITFWYDDADRIYNAIICYRTDLDQYLRNSVILEEIYNGLGPIQDTTLREDSIIYSEFTTPQALTQVDELLLKLLYHPLMQCGMNSDECEAVIRQLYF